jgi:hypothetical protein
MSAIVAQHDPAYEMNWNFPCGKPFSKYALQAGRS